ncbi:anaerobic C4-dicarboxylate transporter family protein [Candidatus Cardinium hertigii]|uniref:anaerobic C4-dicarboxylate transporter family protein n=1 Tax=Candidatus Cardinium hertigii TaxID=247481 RepID=UPI003D7E7218
MMSTIGWGMLLMVLIASLYLGGVSLGLLSGLVLGFLTCWIQPVSPPNNLMLLQATWLLLMATLEATGFFYLMTNKWKIFVGKMNNHYGTLIALFCYGLVFLTGDKAWLYRWVGDPNPLHKGKAQLLFPIVVAGHMALLASPLSISGILLIVVAGNNGLPILNLVGMIATLGIGITAASSWVAYLIPNKWLSKLYGWLNGLAKDEVAAQSKNKIELLLFLLVVAELLFLGIAPNPNGSTQFSSIQKIFPVKFPIFFALVMLSTAAVAMLGFKIKPAKILQSNRFKLGIQQLFIFLGLTWLVDSLLSHDKMYWIKMWWDSRIHYGFYLAAVLYMLLIDVSIIIWLFSTPLIERDDPIAILALWLVAVHSLAPIRFWMSHMIKGYKNKQIER